MKVIAPFLSDEDVNRLVINGQDSIVLETKPDQTGKAGRIVKHGSGFIAQIWLKGANQWTCLKGIMYAVINTNGSNPVGPICWSQRDESERELRELGIRIEIPQEA